MSPATEQPLLSVAGLEVRFGDDAPAVSNVELTVRSGQTVAVVGESGSGKSTTAAAILGLLAPGGRVTAGRIVFDGIDIVSADPRRLRSIRGTGIGYVPQDPTTNLNPVWKVGFQIRGALRANNINDAKQRSLQLLDEAGMPDPPTPGQTVSASAVRWDVPACTDCASGLAGRPRLLIADEPTSALGRHGVATVQVLDHLQHLAAELGTAVLLITPRSRTGRRARRTFGRHAPRPCGGNRCGAIDLERPTTSLHPAALVAAAPSVHPVGGATARPRPDNATPVGGSEPRDLLVAADLTKTYRSTHGTPWRKAEFRAVDGVSFVLRKATTLAIVGESGSGKSTLARMVLDLLAPTSGTVMFDGRDVAAMNRREVLAFCRRVQPVFQNPYSSLDPMYTVFRAIEEPLRIHRIGDRRERRAAVRELADQVALPLSVLERRPRELSGGQRQRVGIARALALRPDVVVCDEAVSALDVLVQAQILELLAELKDALRLSYLFISHDLAVVRQIAEEVLVMQAGRVVEHAPTDEVFTQPQDDYTRQLLAAIPKPYGDRS